MRAAIIIAVCSLVLLVSLAAWVDLYRRDTMQRCANIEIETGRNVRWNFFRCYVEIASGEFVSLSELPYHLDEVRPIP